MWDESSSKDRWTSLIERITQVSCLAALVFCWHWLAFSPAESSALYPGPADVLAALNSDFWSGLLLHDWLWSILRAGSGFVLGATLGIVLGILTARSKLAENSIGLVINLIRPIPPIAIVPLFVLWFGLGELPKIGLIVLGVVPPVWLSTHLGIRGVNREYIWTARSLGANNAELTAAIILPAALPTVLSGLKTALGIAFYCLVAAEMAGALYGIAYRIELSNLYYRVDRMLEYLAILGFTFLIFQHAFNRFCARAFPWTSLNQLQHDD